MPSITKAEAKIHPEAATREPSSGDGLLAGKQHGLAFLFRRFEEVDGSVDAPGDGDAEREERFFGSAEVEGRTDQVEGHENQVGQQPEAGNKEVADETVIGALVEGHDAEEAAERVQDEGAEVGCEGDGNER